MFLWLYSDTLVLVAQYLTSLSYIIVTWQCAPSLQIETAYETDTCCLQIAVKRATSVKEIPSVWLLTVIDYRASRNHSQFFFFYLAGIDAIIGIKLFSVWSHVSWLKNIEWKWKMSINKKVCVISGRFLWVYLHLIKWPKCYGTPVHWVALGWALGLLWAGGRWTAPDALILPRLQCATGLAPRHCLPRISSHCGTPYWQAKIPNQRSPENRPNLRASLEHTSSPVWHCIPWK